MLVDYDPPKAYYSIDIYLFPGNDGSNWHASAMGMTVSGSQKTDTVEKLYQSLQAMNWLVDQEMDTEP